MLNVLFDGYERACFNIVIAPVLYKMLDGLSGNRIVLHFIKHNNWFAFIQRNACYTLQVEKEDIQVGYVVKQVFDAFGSLGEVNKDVRFVFPFGKLGNQRWFTHTASSFNEHCCASLLLVFPPKHGAIKLTFEDHERSILICRCKDNTFFANPQMFLVKYAMIP